MPRAPLDLVVVTIRLRRKDIAAARRLARRVGLPYQTWLRERVGEAVEAASRTPVIQ